MPLRDILKNKLLLQENFHTSETAMDDWAFWQFEENIKIANSIIEEKEKKERKRKREREMRDMKSNTSKNGKTNSQNESENKIGRAHV